MLSPSDLYQGIIVPAFILVPITVAIRNYRVTGKAFKILLLYLFVSGGINAIAIVFSFIHKNNLPLLHIYTVAELLLLLQFFSVVISLPLLRKWIVFMQVLFFVFCVVNLMFIQSIYTFNSYTRPIEAIIVICFCLFHLFILSKSDAPVKLTNVPEAWVSSGLVIYFSASLYEFIFANVVSIKASSSMKMLIWNIHDTLVLIMYLLFALGFYKCKK